MKSKEMLRQVIYVGTSRSTICYKRNESAGELRIIKMPGGPQKTTEVDDCRKKPLHNNETGEGHSGVVGASASKSAIRRRLHVCKHRVYNKVQSNENIQEQERRESPWTFWNQMT